MKKIIIFLFALFSFCLPCFASDYPDFTDSMLEDINRIGYFVLYEKDGTYHCKLTKSPCTYYDVEGELMYFNDISKYSLSYTYDAEKSWVYNGYVQEDSILSWKISCSNKILSSNYDIKDKNGNVFFSPPKPPVVSAENLGEFTKILVPTIKTIVMTACLILSSIISVTLLVRLLKYRLR